MQIRCPHCRNPIEVVEEDPSGDVSCPSCGSCFNLAKDAETGRLLGAGRMLGHFELLDRLGQGAFGEVWKARDTKLDRIVAIKFPRKQYLTEAESEQFLREARSAAQVRHPNIVSVHEVGRENGQIYIASDFIEGATLDEWIQAHPLSVRESAELCAKIAEALHHAHDAGIVHRDLKPQNILVRVDGGRSKVEDQTSSSVSGPPPSTLHLQPFITDFGLAKRDAGEITMTVDGAILGTPAYMPPEQARGEAHHADRRSDVYALGVILFRLLTGELPFRGQRQMLLQQILNEDPPSPRKLDARIPRDVETICLKCLEKDPARRYQSAAALAADLRRWLTGHPITARPVSRTERAWRWCHRNPTVASLSATVALVLLTGIAVSSFFALQSAARNRDLLSETTRANKKTNEALANADRADTKAEEVRRHLYAAQMHLAQRDWENSQVGFVLDSLEKTHPQHGETDLRGFEWYYWDRLCHSYLLDLKGHTDGVACVAFSPDGKRLASASDDNTVKVWDATSGQETFTLKGHTGGVACVAFSPDGKRLASASDDNTVKVWDATTGQETFTLKGHTGGVACVAFSPDGKRLASASDDNTVKVWDATSGQETFTLKGHTGKVTSVAFSPDGERLASASEDHKVKLWDAMSGQEMLTFDEHHGRVTSVAFSPDGMHLATASYDQTVKVWDATSGHEALTLNGHTAPVTSVAFSPYGERLASASEDQTVKLWDATTGQELVLMTEITSPITLKGHSRSVTSVAFSPDGKRLASASDDRTVKLWDAIWNQNTLRLSGHSGLVKGVAFSLDGKRLALAGDDRTVKLWDAIWGQNTLTLKGHSDSVNGLAFSLDGKRLASASDDRTVKLWDAISGQEMLTLRRQSDVVDELVAFSANNKWLVSTSGYGTMKLWDTTSGQEMLTLKGHTGKVTSVAISSDGIRLASAHDDQTVKLWDATSGQEIFTLKGHSDAVRSVAFNPDGKRLASASDDQTIKLWDVTTGQETLNLKGHTSYVNCIAFSPDGKRLASASHDQTVRLWDTATGQEMLTLKSHYRYIDVASMAFSADGKRLASASLDGKVQVWDARPWMPELRAESEAVSLIHFLRDHDKPQAEWLDAISADQTISEPVRQRALQFAREWK